MAIDNPAPSVGSQIVFTITVTNNGNYTATNIVVKDSLPTNLNYVSDNGGGSYISGTGFWTIPSASGATATLKISLSNCIGV
ncbi:MAG: DUF11 domain-containing protein [Anaerolineales bacterium]|nr:DUF11 domain-containing protein [Anaerolineales bacterium]